MREKKMTINSAILLDHVLDFIPNKLNNVDYHLFYILTSQYFFSSSHGIGGMYYRIGI